MRGARLLMARHANTGCDMVVGGNLNSPLNRFILVAKALMEEGLPVGSVFGEGQDVSTRRVPQNIEDILRSHPLPQDSYGGHSRGKLIPRVLW